ncbi:pre-peptidase C-terminal domain-containing protein, partial [Crocosphaera watsonii]|uniref:pre-peptidase C-terminal domain-containing protein n=1 Tax=Crocosphaera watsonii TaxID=263511 RepID=UPI0006524923
MKKAVLTTTILSLLLPLTSGEAQNINSRVIGLSSEGIVLLANNVKGLNVEGRLDNNSQTLDDGSYYNVHTFEGKAGETLTIDLSSEDFDAYLILLDPDGEKIGEKIASNDNGGEGYNARIVIELPKTGTYIIGVNTVEADETGNYRLNTRQATQKDTKLAIASGLNDLAQLYQSQGRYSEAEPLFKTALAIKKEQLGDNHPDTAT